MTEIHAAETPLVRQVGRPRWVWIVAAAAAGAVVGSGLTLGIQSMLVPTEATSAIEPSAGVQLKEDTRLVDAFDSCGAEGGLQLSDGNRTLTFDSEGEEDYGGLQFSHFACLLAALDTPARVVSHIDQTTAMDGRQSETWNGLTMEWSYHPDRGADGVISLD